MDKKWKLIKADPVFESKWLTVENRTYELPDGKRGENYVHVLRPDYVLILAKDRQDRIVVERQYRRGVDDFVYELPAGWIDKGETPLSAAVRELKEETGFVGSGEEKLTVYPEPAFMSMKAHIVFLEFDETTMSEQNLSDDEHLKWELINIDKVKKMIKEKRIQDMGFLAAMSVYENL